MNKIIVITGAMLLMAAGCSSQTNQTKTTDLTPTPTTQAATSPTPTPTPTKSTTVTPTPSATPTASMEKTFSMADVAKANTPENCYSAINGIVYNLTAWINKHPGGDRAILSLCGKDGSSAFNGQHGGENKPEKVLAGFEIGKLK